MKTSHKFVRGFTLIELLIVIAIIAILTGIIMTSLTPAKSKARDAKRISDIGQIQVALSLYFDRCKEYPPAPLTVPGNNCTGTTGTVNLGTYISTIPLSPSPGSYIYAVNTDKTDYILRTSLENYNEILKDDIDTTTIGSTDCTDTAPNYYYCLGSR